MIAMAVITVAAPVVVVFDIYVDVAQVVPAIVTITLPVVLPVAAVIRGLMSVRRCGLYPDARIRVSFHGPGTRNHL